MKVSGGYKFTLQFSGRLPTHRRVGEFLNQLGNKKSEFIIPIISAYLDQHPEYEKGEARMIWRPDELQCVNKVEPSSTVPRSSNDIKRASNALGVMLDCIDGL